MRPKKLTRRQREPGAFLRLLATIHRMLSASTLKTTVQEQHTETKPRLVAFAKKHVLYFRPTGLRVKVSDNAGKFASASLRPSSCEMAKRDGEDEHL